MYRGGPGGEACEDERKLKNVTETVYDACHGPFFCCPARRPFFPVLPGAMRCPGVCTGLQRQNRAVGPENADKSGKKQKNENFLGTGS